jgi:hypothetical protein
MISLRRATSLTITFSFFIMTYTGILLFIAPKGRVANWINWELFGLDKTQYTNLHVTFMVLFLVGMVFHLYLNWKPLMVYLKNRQRQFSLLTKEFIFAVAINALFVVGTLSYWAPFDQFLDFEEDVKNSWETKVDKAPYGHAELSTLEEFSNKTGLELEIVIKQLTLGNLKGISSEKTIAAIAKENGKSPSQVFDILAAKTKVETPKAPALKEGGGYGKLSLSDAASQHHFDLTKALELLKEKGATVTEKSTLRDAADTLHVTPIELLEMLKKPN